MLLPHDIAVLVEVRRRSDAPWTQRDLSQALYISLGGIHAALQRCTSSELYDPDRRKVRMHNLFVLLGGGFQFIFHGELGPRRRGIPTAWSAAPLNLSVSFPAEEQVVWPAPEGEMLGHSIEPLYRGAPAAATANPQLHELLALLDGLRLGDVRVRKLAMEELQGRLR